jgi:hypothetical protein
MRPLPKFGLWPWLFLLGTSTCVPQTSPERGRYACLSDGDCGEGYECRAQFDRGGLCFKRGLCDVAESCNGLDDDCDGRVDETFPGKNDACDTGKLGVCASGLKGCVEAAIVCLQQLEPRVEVCDGLDDDCDGFLDEGFVLAADDANCGRCGAVCDAGTNCAGGSCVEASCADQVDNDQNGSSDCADPACLGRRCAVDASVDWNCGRPDAGANDGGESDAGTGDGGVGDGGGAFPVGGANACVPTEQDCENGADDDGDGLADCLDGDCDGRRCSAGTACAARACPGPG